MPNLDLEFTQLPKLVRDNIPEIIFQNEGIKASIEVLDDLYFLESLQKKLVEESLELYKAKNDIDQIEAELGDIYEVLEKIISFLNLDKDKIKALQTAKKVKNGGFDKKIVLIKM